MLNWPIVTQQVMMKAWQTPELAGVFSSYQVNVPQLDLDVDRTKALSQGVSLDTAVPDLTGLFRHHLCQ